MKLQYDYPQCSQPHAFPVWRLVRPLPHIGLDSSSFVYTKAWFDARETGAVELGLLPEQVEVIEIGPDLKLERIILGLD